MSFPELPYDNLYKFLAITGVMLFLAGFLFPIFSYYYLEEKHSEDILEKLKADMQIDEMQKEYDEIKSGYLVQSDVLLKNLTATYSKINETTMMVTSDMEEFNVKANSINMIWKKSISIIKNSGIYDVNTLENGNIQFVPKKEYLGKPMKKEIQMAFFILDNINMLTESLQEKKENILLNKDILGVLETEFWGTSEQITEKREEFNRNADEIIQQAEVFIKDEYVDKKYYYDIYLDRVKAVGRLEIWTTIISVIGLVLSVFGFYQWYRLHQKLIDESLRIDLELKRHKLQEIREEKAHKHLKNQGVTPKN